MSFIKLFFALFFLCAYASAQDNPYQIGSKWGRSAYTYENADMIPSFLSQQLKAVARFDGGTAFYLGKFDGKHLMATNHHVLPGALNCYSFNWVTFAVTDKFFSCKSHIATFSEVELTLFELKIKKEEEYLLEGLGIEFERSPRDDTRLYGAGYGFQNNPMRKSLLLSDDEHCKFFSEETRFISDPDTINTADYKVWSRPVGCDFSHGDSGAPVFNALGEFVGINWTGGAPKPSIILSDRFLNEIHMSAHPSVWKDLSYIVPSYKIIEALEGFLTKEPEHPYSQALKELLQ